MTGPRPRLSRRKYAAFALASVLITTLVLTACLVGVDLYLHRRHAVSAGLNVWGYRGPVVQRKAPGVRRIVVVGGSTTFGYGVSAEAAMPALLERALRTSGTPDVVGPIDVVNLGFNNEGAYAFRLNLEDFRHLDYDLAVFYTGYNDLSPGNTTAYRRSSPIFRLTGYMPILPVILAEKAMVLRHGNLEAAYRGERTAFRPTMLQQTGAAAIEAAATVVGSIERQFGRLSSDVDSRPRRDVTEGCGAPWTLYCGRIASAIDYALSQGTKALVVGQPYIADVHVEQQAALESMLRQRYGTDPRVKVLNLGRIVDLADRTLAFDGMHLTAAGNRLIAEALAPSVAAILR